MSLNLLFAAPACLLDRSSGAAMSVLELLQRLRVHGIAVQVSGCTVFDSITASLALPRPPAVAGDSTPIDFQVERDGLQHQLMRTRHWRRNQLTAQEEARFEALCRRMLHQSRPDALLLYGGLLLERMLLAEARRLGIATLFYLVNSSYHDPVAFRDVTRVVTDTAATAELYRSRMGLRATPVGKFIDPAKVRCPRDEAQAITFVNPSPEKGAALVVALALRCSRELPEARFLVVESRRPLAPLLAELGVAREALPNLEILPLQHDMRTVLARTRVLLLPSYWHESGSRLALEAMLNGIPVLASEQGGNAEVLDGGGELIAIPPEVRAEPLKLPAATVVEPWFEALRRLLRDPAAEQAAIARAHQAASRHDPEHSVQRFVSVLREAVAR